MCDTPRPLSADAAADPLQQQPLHPLFADQATSRDDFQNFHAQFPVLHAADAKLPARSQPNPSPSPSAGAEVGLAPNPFEADDDYEMVPRNHLSSNHISLLDPNASASPPPYQADASADLGFRPASASSDASDSKLPMYAGPLFAPADLAPPPYSALPNQSDPFHSPSGIAYQGFPATSSSFGLQVWVVLDGAL